MEPRNALKRWKLAAAAVVAAAAGTVVAVAAAGIPAVVVAAGTAVAAAGIAAVPVAVAAARTSPWVVPEAPQTLDTDAALLAAAGRACAPPPRARAPRCDAEYRRVPLLGAAPLLPSPRRPREAWR